MHESTLSTLLQNTYVHSEVAYRIGLLKEFLEFAFFTVNAEKITTGVIKQWGSEKKRVPEDQAFLESLPENFFDAFTRDTFYDVLDAASNKAEEFPTLSLEVPVEFSADELHTIGSWARKEVDPMLMLTIEVDASISAGCRFVWRDHLYDFSFAHYLAEHEDELHQRLDQRIDAMKQENKK